MQLIASEAELRKIVPEPSPKVRLKILDRLEKHSLHMIGVSSLSALASAAHVALFVARGAITAASDGQTFRIADPHGEHRRHWTPGTSIGGLFMVMGIQETMRVNGRVVASDSDVVVEVEEVFLQCPKAFVRSKLWEPTTWTGGECTVETAPFALVATEGADGRGDVSPRGDPEGLFVRRLDERTLLLPDRTGNHLVDTLRNVLHRPHATLLFVRPGCADVLRIDAHTRITADAALLAPSAVKGKAPKLGIVLDIEREGLLTGALDGLWRPEAIVDPKDFPTFGEMILDQVNPGGKVLNAIGAKLFDLGSEYHKRRHLY
jgi:uncharacterized protein